MTMNNKQKDVRSMKAYDNTAFLNSKTARSIRIMCELEETRERLAQNNVERTILFFGTARAKSYADHAKAITIAEERIIKATADNDSDALAQCNSDLKRLKSTAWLCRHFDDITELSTKVTEWCLSLVNQTGMSVPFMVSTGGGPGLMEAANKGASQVPMGQSIGMGISLPFEDGLNPYVTPDLGFQFKYFFTRKFFMLNSCAAIIALPGGVGTMDELFEALTLMQTGKINRMPIVLFGEKYWNDVVNWQTMVDYGTISQSDVDQLFFTDSVDEAYKYIVDSLTAVLHKDKSWLDKSCSDLTTKGLGYVDSEQTEKKRKISIDILTK